jgi:AraC-like DNA-binding protein/ligand-binding sensor protein
MPVFTSMVHRVAHSQILADYESAFAAATGLPVRFQPVGQGTGEPALPLRRHPEENPFCALLAQNKEGCRMCLNTDQQLQSEAAADSHTVVCLAGLADTAVPVTIQGRLAGYLRTGQVALAKPNPVEFSKIGCTLLEWGFSTDLRQAEEAWMHSKVLAPRQYEAFVQLLKVFSRHLSLVADHLPAAPASAEPPLVNRARAYIDAHQQEDLHVEDVSKALNISVFYFCKVFKKATGMTFTEYLSKVRVLKARTLLENPHARVSEVAFAAGFQSLTHFNRIFRKFTGHSPTAYRALRLPNADGLTPSLDA